MRHRCRCVAGGSTDNFRALVFPDDAQMLAMTAIQRTVLKRKRPWSPSHGRHYGRAKKEGRKEKITIHNVKN
ncbi:hypothetical protein L596_010687 [Steinernema carpocapsae]|uniref:Uncharacterized protein n=1 Tax=Steinernema carpocapsae TaxID=34508 RepID=A0A4U5PKS7_STECR|nr:hypothetical protein L596_010687 [Steinernema carpocapsae]